MQDTQDRYDSKEDGSQGAQGSYGSRRALQADRVGQAAIGLEAEFTVLLNGEPVKPEDLFGSPRAIVEGPMMHRVGRSYHLPTGGAVYFDTGVVEIATPMIELSRGCAARAGRSLWESIEFLRTELDGWQERNGGQEVKLAGFSAHYNVSFELAPEEQRGGRTVKRLALLLTYILPFPLMLLATNRRSTGVGVRPRGNRVEVTMDFTPDPALMIAAATFIVGAVREVMTWESYGLEQLNARGIPVVAGFEPVPHSSRKGWSAKYTCFDVNPFEVDIDDARWRTTAGETLSLRAMARRIGDIFRPAIVRWADPRSLRLVEDILSGRMPSLLQLSDRPASYDRVGEDCRWNGLFKGLSRSRYEQVFLRAIGGAPLRIRRDRYVPTGIQGWTRIVFRRERDGTRHVFSLDRLVDHLPSWPAPQRRRSRGTAGDAGEMVDTTLEPVPVAGESLTPFPTPRPEKLETSPAGASLPAVASVAPAQGRDTGGDALAAGTGAGTEGSDGAKRGRKASVKSIAKAVAKAAAKAAVTTAVKTAAKPTAKPAAKPVSTTAAKPVSTTATKRGAKDAARTDDGAQPRPRGRKAAEGPTGPGTGPGVEGGSAAEPGPRGTRRRKS